MSTGTSVTTTREDGGFDYALTDFRCVTSAYTYDAQGRIVSETAPERGTTVRRFTVWLGNVPLVQVDRRVRRDGTTRRAEVLYLHTDHLGAVRGARDTDGTLVWSWEAADALGGRIPGEADDGAGVDRDPDGDGRKITVPLRFPGKYHDRESGLFHNRYRDYNPRIARYIQPDPIGLDGVINRYTSGEKPLRYISFSRSEAVATGIANGIGNRDRSIKLSGILVSVDPARTRVGFEDPNYNPYKNQVVAMIGRAEREILALRRVSLIELSSARLVGKYGCD